MLLKQLGTHGQTTMEVATKEGACVQHISGQFNVRAELQEDGWFRVKYNSATTNYSPWSSSNAQNDVRDMQRTGATIESSQWVGKASSRE